MPILRPENLPCSTRNRLPSILNKLSARHVKNASTPHLSTERHTSDKLPTPQTRRGTIPSNLGAFPLSLVRRG